VLEKFKSIGIGLAIIIAAIGCFILSAYLVSFPLIESIAIYSAHGPIENIFLILITIIVGMVFLVSGLNETPYKTTLSGWFVFFGCLLVFGLFGIPGLFAFSIGGKLLVSIYAYISGNKI
jgi:hypothetical protein